MGGNNGLIVCCFPNSFHAQDVARNDAYKMYLIYVAQIKCVNLFNCVLNNWSKARKTVSVSFRLLQIFSMYNVYYQTILCNKSMHEAWLPCSKQIIDDPYNHSNNAIFRRKMMNYRVISSNIFFAHLYMMEVCVGSFRHWVKIVIVL